jgi:hypothetical protein
MARAIFFGGKMTSFQGQRVSHAYEQINCATPEKVFPLLCPVREADWVLGWQYRMIYAKSGVAEDGCVFTTPNDDGSEATWIVIEYDPVAFRVGFAWVNPGLLACLIRIQLTSDGQGNTKASIGYHYTGLSPEGNAEVERYDQRWFQHKMRSWEGAINHYLQTGEKIDASTWE